MAAQNFASASTVVGIVVPMRPQPSAKLAALGGNAEDITKGIVDAARCGIQIRVHTDGRDAVFHQQSGHIIGSQRPERMEDDRVMADDELAVVFHSLPHDGGVMSSVVSTLSTGVPASTSSPTLSQSNASSCGATARRKPKSAVRLLTCFTS